MTLPGLAVLGTDTEVGKTFVACRIIESLVRDGIKVGAYKPVASGAPTREQSDGFLLWQASGRRGTLDEVNPQHFFAPLAPPVAAELEGRQISDECIVNGARHWSGRCEFLVLEGAGGLMSPLSWTMTNAKLASDLQFPIVLVSENRLGVVNQVLTSITAAHALGLTVCCIVLNEKQSICDQSAGTNEHLIQLFLNTLSDPPKMTVIRRNQSNFDTQHVWQNFA